jgi:DNA replication protein DnaC
MEMFHILNIPEVLKDCSLRDVQECEHKKVVTNYIGKMPGIVGTRQGLYLWGDYGQGKSALAAILLQELAKYELIGFWVFCKLLPGYVINNNVWLENITYYERCVEVPLLVLDEFQIRPEIKFQESCVEDLLRLRVSANKPTIITSNIVPSMIRSTYPAFFSVLQECCYPQRVEGHDWRAANKGLVVEGLI